MTKGSKDPCATITPPDRLGVKLAARERPGKQKVQAWPGVAWCPGLRVQAVAGGYGGPLAKSAPGVQVHLPPGFHGLGEVFARVAADAVALEADGPRVAEVAQGAEERGHVK